MPVIDVVLRMRASVEVRPDQVQPVRERLQAALDAVAEAMEELGVVADPDSEFTARVRGEGGAQ